MPKEDAASADAPEKAFLEFIKKQDMKSALPPSADTNHALREYIERHGNLRFVMSEESGTPPFAAPPETEPAPAGKPAKARSVSELSRRTRDQARKAEARRFTPAINAALLLAAWALMVFFAVQFVGFPLNYILGAAFIAPIVLIAAKLLRNAGHQPVLRHLLRSRFRLAVRTDPVQQRNHY